MYEHTFNLQRIPNILFSLHKFDIHQIVHTLELHLLCAFISAKRMRPDIVEMSKSYFWMYFYNNTAKFQYHTWELTYPFDIRVIKTFGSRILNWNETDKLDCKKKTTEILFCEIVASWYFGLIRPNINYIRTTYNTNTLMQWRTQVAGLPGCKHDSKIEN
jgi:hypothetical protein